MPPFGVMAAVLQRGECVAGVIHDPIADDCAVGIAGHGAWIERADGTTEELGATASADLGAGDAFVIETPGGGGYGKAEGD